MHRVDARLHDRLVEIHAEMQDPANWHSNGICAMLGAQALNGRFYRLAQQWPVKGGTPAFPVPTPEGSSMSPAFTFMYNPPSYHWGRDTSPYAELRWQLLEWAIEETANA